MLQLKNVTMEYTVRGHAVCALREANLHVGEGEYVSIIGHSGSGKSTLLLILGGMLSPTSGEVLFREEDLFRFKPDHRAKIRGEYMGFVFQTFNLIPYLTALENVMLPLYLTGKSADEQAARAEEMLKRVELGHRLDHKPGELSIGQQQRVALARMLAGDPRIILADEPTGSLDPETGRHILDFLDALHAEGKAIVMVTHDPNAAGRAERRLRIEEGRIISDEKISHPHAQAVERGRGEALPQKSACLAGGCL